MAASLFLLVFVLVMSSSSSTAQGPPSPGYYPSSSVQSNGFTQYFRNLWGPQHQRLDDQGSVTIWLDSTSGSGFKSLRSYRSGYFGVAVKLQSGYTCLTLFWFSFRTTNISPETTTKSTSNSSEQRQGSRTLCKRTSSSEEVEMETLSEEKWGSISGLIPHRISTITPFNGLHQISYFW